MWLCYKLGCKVEFGVVGGGGVKVGVVVCVVWGVVCGAWSMECMWWEDNSGL